MIIANFNVENLFERSRAVNLSSWRAGQLAINAAGELNALYAPREWESFENINSENKDGFQASDHHCPWAEVDV